MIHIGVSAKIKDFEVPFFIGYFKIPKAQDLTASARGAITKYVKDRNRPEFWGLLREVEVYERATNKTLLIIKI